MEKGLQALFIFQDSRLGPDPRLTKLRKEKVCHSIFASTAVAHTCLFSCGMHSCGKNYILQKDESFFLLLTFCLSFLSATTSTAPPSRDPSDGVVLRRLEPFLPALHHALLRLRSHPPKDLAAAVERQAVDYLIQQRCDRGRGPPFRLPEYRQHLDERPSHQSGPRPRFSGEALRSYLHGPATYQLATTKAHNLLCGEGMDQRRTHRPAAALASATAATVSSASAAAGNLTVSPTPSPAGTSEDRSPASDWGGQEKQCPGPVARVAQSNGGSQRAPSRSGGGGRGVGGGGGGGQYDKEKMEKLLQLIHMHKRTLAEGREDEEEGWDTAGLKRRLEDEGGAQASKYLRTSLLSNGEPGRGKSKGWSHGLELRCVPLDI